MLFTFITDPPAQHPPMRVRVFETCASSSFNPPPSSSSPSARLGAWYSFDEVGVW